MNHTSEEVRAEAASFARVFNERVASMLTAYADSIERAQAGVTESVRVAGAMLANCAFNLAQCDRLTERERRSLDESRKAWDAAIAGLPASAEPAQATTCAGCGKHKPTPLRIDAMGGYVCLTCIDEKLSSLLGEFGYPEAQPAANGRVELERWGLPDATRMAKRCEDGYWTPWHVAQAAVDALTAQGQGDAVATVASMRAELVAKIGDCCMGGDPLCTGGCLAEKAAKRNAEREAALAEQGQLPASPAGVPDALRELVATWRKAVLSASCLNKQDLRPFRFIRDVEALLAAASQPGES